VNRPSLVFFNFVIFWILLLLLAAFQTTALFWLLKGRLHFNLAILVLVYIIIYRKTTEGLVFTFLAGYTMGLMSSMMESIAVLACLILFFSIRVFRARVYTSGPVYFAWVALGSILLFHIITLVVGSSFEPNPPVRAPVLSWILEAFLTSLVVRPAYAIFYWIDIKTNRSAEMELAG